jgi:transcriptional regulator with XRE-family HTH domain
MQRGTDLGQALVLIAQIDGMSQLELAAKAGLSPTTVSAAATGRRPSALRTVEKLRRVVAPTEDLLDRVRGIIRDRRSTKHALGSADSVAEATGASYADDDCAREIGRAFLRIFELIDIAGKRKASLS